jgi:GNAT superfamily N-acetyltransferase
MSISTAASNDIPAIVKLVNSAYRGEFSKKGWTSEADLLVGGERVNAIKLRQMMEKENAVVLKYEKEPGIITGCVYLEILKNHVYLGMLTVSPEYQGAGIGKNLLNASEKWTRDKGIFSIQMTVISVRSELISWYQRQGYIDSGNRKPYTYVPGTGEPSQHFEFIVMEKKFPI